MNAFILFSNKFRSEVIKNNPGVKMSVIAEMLGARWRQLTDAEKEAYKKEARKLKEETTKLVEEDELDHKF